MTLHVIPLLGTTALAKLAAHQVQWLYSTKHSEGLSSTTVYHLHAVLHKALVQAERLELVARNVCDLVDAPRMVEQELQVLDREQVRTLLEAAHGDRLEALYVLAVTTGMRRSELLALRWRDVDLAAGTVQVRATLQHHNGTGFALGQAWEDHGLVFPNALGRPEHGNCLRRSHFQPLLVRAGLPRIRFHDLLHTAATLMLGQGIHPKIVSERLGHSTVGISLNVYNHVQQDMQDQAAAAISAALGS
jgi:integrase